MNFVEKGFKSRENINIRTKSILASHIEICLDLVLTYVVMEAKINQILKKDGQFEERKNHQIAILQSSLASQNFNLI